jgi:two-component system response regulator HydG
MNEARERRKPRLLIVDDEPEGLRGLAEGLERRFDVHFAPNASTAQDLVRREPMDVALLGLARPDDSLSLLGELKSQQPEMEVAVMSMSATSDKALDAMRLGARDFIEKTLEQGAIVQRLEQLVRKRVPPAEPELALVGKSPAMSAIREMVTSLAKNNSAVLVLGESGTGKELVARALHSASNRASRPFVAVNCAAMNESLIDSELFGYERGAFTGATTPKSGLFEAANGGVLFLDEVGDIALATQVRLLRALQNGEIRPVGATQPRRVDVRVITATNVDLAEAMNAGRFRSDLYYRLNTFQLPISPLRERPEDILELARHFLARGSGPGLRWELTAEAEMVLLKHRWPGNVRELEHAMEHAVALCPTGQIRPEHLPFDCIEKPKTAPERLVPKPLPPAVPYREAREQWIRDFELAYLEQLVDSTGGSISEASRASGIDRSNLRRLLRRHGLLNRMGAPTKGEPA